MNWEIVALIIYFVAMLSIGMVFFLRNKSKTDKDYFLGGRSMGPWVTAMSAQASDMSAWLLMGLPGSVLAFGLGQAWIGIGLALGTALNWILVARRLRRFSAAANDSITLPQYLSNRFATKSKTLQVICAIVFLVCFTVYVASAFVAGAGVFASIFSVKKSIAMAIFAVILIIYTFLGGYKAVCWTDFFQGLLMIVAVLAVPIILAVAGDLDTTAVNNTIISVGSGETVAEVIDAGKSSFSSAIFNASITDILNGLAWGLGYFGMPQVLVRFMSVRHSQDIKMSRMIAMIWLVISLSSAVCIGLIGRAYLPDMFATQATAENIFIVLSQMLLPSFFCGLVVSSIFA
ncbi:MAG: sodium/proline symporter, partial [Clostridia bacterium]|nr:sodium/proline symporter [Clostridia bacterium]